MTAVDWFGALFTLVGLVFMVWAYYYAFSPSRREKFHKDWNIPMNDEPERKPKGV
jgi:cbb3-type cytochrome oxidase subunit 3